ncbi:MAG TPA: hypothetical protein VFV33_08310 [Gemmatimonadaceae bacterium]|nr:hypothetical protein [Gemmatimonadaceae bacterium]
MVASLASLMVKLTFIRGLLALLASVLVVLPLGLAMLKVLALPLVAVLALIGLPLLVVIALLGFPFFVVFAIAGVVLALLAAVVTFGFIALKVFLFVILPGWLAYCFVRWVVRGASRGQAESRAAADVGE